MSKTERVLISNLERFKMKLVDFDWVATIPDDRYCDYVHPALMDVVCSFAAELGIDFDFEDDEAYQPFFDAVNENFLKHLTGEPMLDKQREDVKLHLADGIRSLRCEQPEVKQAEHNFFEIADHLGIDANELTKQKDDEMAEQTAELDRMVEEISHYLSTEAMPDDVQRVYDACK